MKDGGELFRLGGDQWGSVAVSEVGGDGSTV